MSLRMTREEENKVEGMGREDVHVLSARQGILLSSQESGLRGCISFSISLLVHVGLAVASVVVERLDQLPAW